MSSSVSELELKLAKKKLLEEKQKIREGLPHLHGFKMYQWQRDYFESDNRHCFISAANQIGKSSISIRRCINRATDPKLWPKLYGKTPVYFMYFYPSLKLATREVDTKWIPEFLPRKEFKEHAIYGWEAEYKGGEIKAIHFKSGVSILFMAYAQAAIDLQAASPSEIYIDEEPPVEIIDELLMRIEGPSKGYFSMVATPTLGQPYFQEVFERKRFPSAFVMTISMYKCLQYEDGSPGPFTVDDIKKREAILPTKHAVDMRIHGKFVKAEGLVYPSFDREKNFLPGAVVPKNWLWFSGVDPGSGGPNNHPAAIAFIAVAPDFKSGRVVETWRGNKIDITTSEDVLRKYIDMRGDRTMTGEFYDWADKDFHTIAMRAGVNMVKAEKNHTIGVNMMNTLFKNGMLMIDENEENRLLVEELESHRVDKAKRRASDDLIDAVRYAITKIFWDFTGIRALPAEVPKKKLDDTERSSQWEDADFGNQEEIDAEIEAWNEHFEV